MYKDNLLKESHNMDFVKKTYGTIRYFGRKISSHRVSTYSAEGAFFMLLSLFPFLTLLLSLIRFLPFEEQGFTGFMGEFLPSEVMDLFSGLIDGVTTAGTNTVTWVSGLTMLWSASKGMKSIVKGLNSVAEVRESRNAVYRRFLSLFYTLAFVIVLIVIIIFMVFGGTIASWIRDDFPRVTAVLEVLLNLRFAVGFCLLVFFFALVYRFIPCGKRRFTAQLPGSLVASAGWIAFTFLFSFYIDNFSNYANIYGSITAIVILLLWLYICMFILYIGAELNLYYLRRVLGE